MPVPFIKMLCRVEIDAILYAQDQVVLVEPPRSDDVIEQEHGAVVPTAPVWIEHACRLATEFGGEPPWLGCVAVTEGER
jgi:hypothetical protein